MRKRVSSSVLKSSCGVERWLDAMGVALDHVVLCYFVRGEKDRAGEKRAREEFGVDFESARVQMYLFRSSPHSLTRALAAFDKDAKPYRPKLDDISQIIKSIPNVWNLERIVHII